MDADEEGDTSIKAAQGILQRLRRRDLYKFVDEFTVPREELDADRSAFCQQTCICNRYDRSRMSEVCKTETGHLAP